jgi:hypothetical protein
MKLDTYYHSDWKVMEVINARERRNEAKKAGSRTTSFTSLN